MIRLNYSEGINEREREIGKMPSTSGAAKTASSVNKPLVDGYAPGTLVAVGNQQVEVLNYLAEGGFAQIYSVKYIKFLGEFENGANAPLQLGDVVCLKRVLVPDENGLSEMRNEVEVMKQLRGASAIIQYYDSNASRRTNGGYEVLLLMELCSNNSLLDYMNQRLATKLNEKEILKIMYDTTLAISQMHYLPVPLIHRDIKIENVLVDAKNNFKLCDFGSTSACFPLVTTHQDIAMLTQNIYVNTTPQYRSPEMIDLYRCLPINEKSDIWALGIFLYKLLFFMTPFEMTGQFAILHSKYEFPANNYSSKLINLIIIMLAENPYVRPNIYQVMHHICSVIGCEVPIEDKYGLGPYNFEKYTEFQTKLQNVQYQMFLLQQKKLENNGHLNAVESKMLNDLLITSFEVSSKIPAEFGGQQQPLKSRDAFNSSDELSDHRKSVFSSRNPSRNPSSASRKNPPSGSELETELDANTDAEYKQLAAASMADRESQSHFNLPNQKSISSYSSGKSLSGGPPSQDHKSSDALVGEQTAKSEQSPGVIKQHKSNNPFPMMAQGLTQSNQPSSSAAGAPVTSVPVPPAGHIPPLAVPPVPAPAPGHGVQPAHAPGPVQIPDVGARGTPTSVRPEVGNRPEYFMDANSSPEDPQFKHSQPVPIPQAQAQPRMNFNQGMFYQHADSPVPVHRQMQPIAFNNIPDVTQSQSHMRYNYQVPPPQQQPQPGSSSYYPSPPIGPKASLSSQNPLLPPQQLPQQRPRPIPSQHPSQQHFGPVPHQQQQQQQEIEQIKQQPQHATTIGTTDLSQPPENPPPKPPHPRTWQDYHVHDRTDFKQSVHKRGGGDHKRGGSDHKSKTEPSVPEKSANKNLDLSYNELDLSTDDSPQRGSHIRQEANTSSDSSESIDIDLDDARKDRTHQQNPGNSQSQSRQRQQQPASNEILTQQSEIPFRQRLNSSSGSLRRSLDLKYQEVNFSSPESEKPATRDATKRPDMRSHAESRRYSNNSLHNKNPNTNSGIENNEVDINSASPPPESPSQNNDDLEKYRDTRKNSSNSSVNVSVGAGVGGPASGAGGEVRRSFAKARQSLDLEKIRREALKGEAAIAGKRRSLFSVFRGNDKK